MTSIPIRTDRSLALLANGTFTAPVLAGCGSDDAASAAPVEGTVLQVSNAVDDQCGR